MTPKPLTKTQPKSKAAILQLYYSYMTATLQLYYNYITAILQLYYSYITAISQLYYSYITGTLQLYRAKPSDICKNKVAVAAER